MEKSNKYNFSTIKSFKEKSNIIYFEVFLIWLTIFLIINLIIYFEYNLIVFPFSFITIGWCQFALSNALHEALHNNFGKKQNNLIASILCAYPIGFMFSYKQIHLDHHKFFGDPIKDPDFNSYNPFPKSKIALLSKLIYNVSGLSAITQFLYKNKTNKKGNEFINLLITQLLLISFFITLNNNFSEGLFMYVCIWILPLITIAKLLSTIRLLCEHGSLNDQLTYRTITGSIIQTKILGPFNFHYHSEHHINPWIPYKYLKYSTSFSNKYQDDNIIIESYNKGYLQLLLDWVIILPWK